MLKIHGLDGHPEVRQPGIEAKQVHLEWESQSKKEWQAKKL
jgi:hypothetical protein